MKMRIKDKNEARHLLANTQNELAELNRMFSRMDLKNNPENIGLNDIEVNEVMQDYAQLASNRMLKIKELLEENK